MLGYKMPLGKSMLGHSMPMGKMRMGHSMPLLQKPMMKVVVDEMAKKVSAGLERNVLKR
jgi:hypothetical protein